MTAHTPAPWVADSYDAHERGCAVIATNGPEIVTPTRGMVAWVGTIAGASFNDPERCEANARVCAAAPDMLALLVELVTVKPTKSPPISKPNPRVGLSEKTMNKLVEAVGDPSNEGFYVFSRMVPGTRPAVVLRLDDFNYAWWTKL